MNDKVAIITPSFNRGYIIGETAESVFAQSHENWSGSSSMTEVRMTAGT